MPARKFTQRRQEMTLLARPASLLAIVSSGALGYAAGTAPLGDDNTRGYPMARKPNAGPKTRRRRRARPSRRIAAIGLLGTGLYATGLPALADAQAPAAAVLLTAPPTP